MSNPVAVPPRREDKLRWRLPLLLFIATCLSTFIWNGPLYTGAVMLTLTAHELGHYFQARRYRVPASLPYFIPMPISPIGTMGAIIAMRSRITHTKALFDIGITGPLAGLGPALLFSYVGIRLSERIPTPESPDWLFGEPLLFKFFVWLHFGEMGEGETILLHPLAFAGWVGIFITALNLLPIGQLDGGHILYALLRRRAHVVATTLLVLATGAVVLGGYWGWSLMILILVLMGPRHPPTLDDHVPLGRGRTVLGWLTLMFLFLGFTPTPFIID